MQSSNDYLLNDSKHMRRFFFPLLFPGVLNLTTEASRCQVLVLQPISNRAIVIHPHFLMRSCHLPSIALQNQAIIVGYPII